MIEDPPPLPISDEEARRLVEHLEPEPEPRDDSDEQELAAQRSKVRA